MGSAFWFGGYELKTLVINFPALMNGGVENICFNLMKYSVSQGYRVIWLHMVPTRIADGFKDFVYTNIEMIPVQRKRNGKWYHGALTFSKEEKITILSFTPFDMDNAFKLCEEFPKILITPIYIVANTKGRYYFVEEYYYGIFRKELYKTVQKLMKNWAEMDAIRFCANGQIDSFENHYGVQISNRFSKVIKQIVVPPELDMQLLKERAKREKFNIVSISRFDFPHKGYLLGLIRAYGKLKSKYPNIYLSVIGYGDGQTLVDDEIKKLSSQAQAGITLLGEIKREDFPNVLKNMHLNISVAGSVGVGAVNGLLSIPARNFCEGECEVYGFLPESRGMTISTEKGEPVELYIEQVINMTNDEYIKRCVESYQVYSNVEVDPEYIFKQRINTDVSILNKHRFLDSMYAFRDYAYKIGTIIHGE